MVLLGTDSPTLPIARMCIRPSMRSTAPTLCSARPRTAVTTSSAASSPCAADFRRRRLEWPGVLGQTVDRIAAANLRLAVLPPWYDVDTFDDWQMLRGHLAALKLAGGDANLRHIRQLPDPPVT